MLKKETIDKIKGYGFDVDKLIAAIKDEKEVDYPVPEFVAMTQAELDARDATKVSEGEKKAEPEIRKVLVKEVSSKLGFTLKGERIGDLVTEIQTKINATGDEKVKTLQDQVALLTKDKDSLTTALQTEKQTTSKALFQTELIGHLPVNRSADLKDRERIMMLTNDIEFVELDGKRVAKRNGEIIKDPKTHAPLPVPDVVKAYATERGWDKAAAGGGKDGGRGGGTDGAGGGAGGLKKFSQVKAKWLEDNPTGNPNSPEFTTHLNKIAKETTDFDMYS